MWSLWRGPACQTPSKALDISSATAQVTPDLIVILSDTSVRRSAVDQQDLQPYWDQKKLFLEIINNTVISYWFGGNHNAHSSGALTFQWSLDHWFYKQQKAILNKPYTVLQIRVGQWSITANLQPLTPLYWSCNDHCDRWPLWSL